MRSLFENIKAEVMPVTGKHRSSAVKGDIEGDQEPNITSHEQHVDSDNEGVSPDAQTGVQKIEATTSVWSTSHLIAAYIM